MKNKVYTLLIISALLFVYMRPGFAGMDPFIGEITVFAGNFAPRDYAFCEGQLLAVSQNVALFSVLGTRYGGDGKTTFALPDLKNAEKSLGGARYIISLKGIYPPRQ